MLITTPMSLIPQQLYYNLSDSKPANSDLMLVAFDLDTAGAALNVIAHFTASMLITGCKWW